MNLNYNELLNKRVKIVCIFGNVKDPIFYDAIVEEYDSSEGVLRLKDKFGKIVFLDVTTIKQIVVV